VGPTLIASPATRVLPISHALDLSLTLGPLRRGPHDPCLRMRGYDVLRATRAPGGPSTLHLQLQPHSGTLHAQAWGPGAEWALEHLPDLIGETDDDAPLTGLLDAFSPQDRSRILLRDLHRRFPGLRIPRSRAVTEALVPTILEQKVAGVEAHRSYRQLVRALGEPAPGPRELTDGLMVPPSPAALSGTPYWAFHKFGIERKRADTVRLACSYASRLDALTDLPPAEARDRMSTLPGIGAWSAAEVALVALGDADAVSVGDFHLPHMVSWALTGARGGDDQTMLDLLEPYRGQRGRVQRLIECSGIAPPRRGPRQAIRSFRDC
jgi:3-methyladenine DNA glycosylase/8-oxoguanine DNA glycosylase